MCGSWTQGVSRHIFDDTIVVMGGGDSLRKVLVLESCWIQDLLLKFFAFSAFSTATPPPTPTVATTPMRMRNLRGLDASIFFLFWEYPANLVGLLVGSEVRTFIILHPGVMIYSNYENLRTWMEQVVAHQNHWSSRSLRVDLSFNTIR